jgi:hypothetical protein
MPYTARGKCVYRKDTGKKIGCTKGSVKKYLAALHANVKDIKESEEFEWFELKNLPEKNDFISQVKYALEGSNYGLKCYTTGELNNRDEYNLIEICEIIYKLKNQKVLQKAKDFFTPQNIKKELDEVLIGERGRYSNDVVKKIYTDLYELLKPILSEDIKESEEFDWVPKEVNLNDHRVLHAIIEDTLKNTNFKIVKDGNIYHIEDEYGDIYFYISERDFNLPFIYHEIKDSIQFLKYEDDNEMLPYYQKLMGLLGPLYKNNIDKLFKPIKESEDNEFDWVEDVASEGINIGDFYKINLDYPIVAKVEDIIFDDSKINSGYVVKVRYFNDNEDEEWGDYLEKINIDWMYDLINGDDHHWVKVTKEYAEKLFKDYKYFKSPVSSEDKNVNESEEWFDEILSQKPLLKFTDLMVGDVVTNIDPNKLDNLGENDIYFHVDSFKEGTTYRNGYAEKEDFAVCSLMKKNPDTGNYYGVSRETINLVKGNNEPIWTLIYREGVMESINKSEDDFEWAEQLFNEPIKDVIEGQYYRANINGKKIDIFIKKIYKGIVTFDALTYDTPRSDKPVLLRREIDLDTPLWNAKRLVDGGYWMPIKKEDKMSNENINESEWFEDVVNEPIMLKVEELEMGDIVIPTCVKDGEYIVMAKGTSVKLLHEPTHWVTLKRHTKANTGGIFIEHDTEIGKNCRFKLIHRENIIEESEEDDFGWAKETVSNLDYLFQYRGKEVMIDIDGFNQEQINTVINIIKPYLSEPLESPEGYTYMVNDDGEQLDWNNGCLEKSNWNGVQAISLHCGIADNDYKPLKGAVCCMTTSYENEPSYAKELIIPVNGRELLGLNNITESEEDEFNWAEDIIANTTEEIDITNDFDLWENKLVEGSVVKITGRWEDMYFEDDIATIVNFEDPLILGDEAGNPLLKFDRVIYEFGNTDEGNHTHCGENETQSIKCECQRKQNNRDEVGKCWWTNLRHMEKIIYLPFEGKQITESEEDSELFWAEDLLDFNNPINITDKLDIMEELPVGSILQVQGYQDEMEFDMDEVKLIDKAEDESFASTYYLFKLKYERGTDGDEKSHCGSGQKNRKICECRPTTEDDDYHESEIGKCWWIELKKQDKVIYYPNRIDLSENNTKKPLLTEGRYDAITRKAVRDIMKLVTTSSFGDHDLPYDINNDEYEYQQENLGFSVELQIIKTTKVEDFFIDAATSDNDEDETVMLVKILLNPKFNKQKLEELFYKLQEVVRHEIEHFTQHGPFRIEDRPTYKGDTAQLKTVYGHHKNVIEIPALVRGFYRRAKIEKRPLDEIMMEDLDSEIEKGFLTKNQAEKLLSIWIDYAKKNLPAAIYKHN